MRKARAPCELRLVLPNVTRVRLSSRTRCLKSNDCGPLLASTINSVPRLFSFAYLPSTRIGFPVLPFSRCPRHTSRGPITTSSPCLSSRKFLQQRWPRQPETVREGRAQWEPRQGQGRELRSFLARGVYEAWRGCRGIDARHVRAVSAWIAICMCTTRCTIAQDAAEMPLDR